MNRTVALLWLTHVFMNAVLLLLVYQWLSIGEQNAMQLALNLAMAGLIGFTAVWIHAALFAHFTEAANSGFGNAFWRASRRLSPFAVGMLLLLAVWWAVGRLEIGVDSGIGKLASWLTLTLRTPVGAPPLLAVAGWIFVFVRWVLVPVAMLPLVAELVRLGFGGFRGQAHRISLRPEFWLWCLLLAGTGAWLPNWLIHWTPRLGSVWLETLSLVLRFGFAYLLWLTSWMALSAFSSGRRVWGARRGQVASMEQFGVRGLQSP